MKKVLMIVGGLAIAINVAFIVTALIGRKRLEPLAVAILGHCDAGAYGLVHAEASTAFQKTTTVGQLESIMSRLRATTGAWRSLIRRSGGRSSTTIETANGSEGTVHLNVDYEKGPAAGDFHFVKEDGTWKLSGLRIEFDSLGDPVEAVAGVP